MSLPGDTLHRCTLCGDFHLSTQPECDECMRAAVAMRSAIEARGGRLTVVDCRIHVHTKVQMGDAIEMMAYGALMRSALDEQRRSR